MEAEIHEDLARFGVSGPGRDWVLRALHPASEKKSPGLPDQSSAFVLRPDYRIVSTISPPAGAGQWDCMMFTLPGDCNAVHFVTAPSPADFTLPSPPLGSEAGVIYLQSTTYSSSTALYVTQYGPAEDQSVTSLPNLTPAAMRHQFKSITVELIAAAVSDQGQVYAGQFAPIVRDCGMFGLGYNSGIQIPGTDPAQYYNVIGRLFTGVLPADEQSLSRMNPDYYQAPAREGVYMPLRLSGPTQEFVRCTTGAAATRWDGTGGFLSQTPYAAPVGAVFMPTVDLAATATSTGGQINNAWPFLLLANSMLRPDGSTISYGNAALDTGYDALNCGVVFFRGLQGGGGGGFGASLQVKTIVGLECLPIPSVGSAVFTEPPAPFEPRAIEAYYRLCLKLKGVYPARFNSWEDIWDAIKDVAGQVWHGVEPVVVGGITNLAHQGLNLLGDLTRRGIREPRRVLYRAPSVARSAMSATSAKSTSRARPKIRLGKKKK
jgi:hypothetical protein